MAYSKHYQPSPTHKPPPSSHNFESSKADRDPKGVMEGGRQETALDTKQQKQIAPKMPGC
jgi:hypothetical protein